MTWTGRYDYTQFPVVFDPARGFLEPYLKNGTSDGLPIRGRNPIGQFSRRPNFAYGLNFLLYYDLPGFQADIPALAAFTAPTETILIADVANLSSRGVVGRDYMLGWPSLNRPGIHGRHNGTANVLWFDGHVKSAHPVFSHEDHLRCHSGNVS